MSVYSGIEGSRTSEGCSKEGGLPWDPEGWATFGRFEEWTMLGRG